MSKQTYLTCANRPAMSRHDAGGVTQVVTMSSQLMPRDSLPGATSAALKQQPRPSDGRASHPFSAQRCPWSIVLSALKLSKMSCGASIRP
jgi:hypothetical protein